MSKITEYLYINRTRNSQYERPFKLDEFYSDKSRILFASSFRRLMQKAQVFSLETNSSVRNRLTHSLEVSDIGRTLARNTGNKLFLAKEIENDEIEQIQTIVECACLVHDIGNPPFGHFGEDAIKKWFSVNGRELYNSSANEPILTGTELNEDISHFDGNQQGFRILTKLHAETDKHSLNLTFATLLASIKYPHFLNIGKKGKFSKKIGIFDVDVHVYKSICDSIKKEENKRYFLSYLMELADDICYSLSDIADSFEKKSSIPENLRENLINYTKFNQKRLKKF